MELDIVFGCVYDLENLFFFFKFFKNLGSWFCYVVEILCGSVEWMIL